MPSELAQWIPPAVIVALMIYLHRSTHRRLDRMETRLREDMAQLRNDMRQDMERLDGRVARLEHGQAKLEGLLEGLREAITRRSVA